MNNIQDTLQNIGQLSDKVYTDLPTNWWLWLAIAEFIVILLLIFFRKKNSPGDTTKQHFKKECMEQEVDFNNIIKSSFHSTELYNKLKVKCHPDLYIGDDEKVEIANRLFQEITRNKTNYNRLYELKEQARQELNVDF